MTPIKNKKYSLIWRIAIEILISLSCVLLSWIGCRCLGPGLVKFTENADKMYYLRHYYDKHNRAQHHGMPIEEVFLVNCNEEGNSDSLVRLRIAYALEKIMAMNPKIVALDIRFKGLHDKTEDDYLKETVYNNKDRIIVARSITGEKKNRSFFDTDDANLKFGYTNIGDFYQTISSYSPSFSEVVLSEAGLINHEFYVKHGILDFSLLNPRPVDLNVVLSADDDIIHDFVENKIVIFGDVEDDKDQIYLPFLANGKEKMPGVYYHIYCMNSLKKNGHFYYENQWGSFIVCFILTILYSIIAMGLTLIVNRTKDNRMYLVALFIKPVLLFWMWFKVPMVLMLFTHWFGFVPDLTLALLSVAGITFLDNFFGEVKQRTLKLLGICEE